MVRTAPRPPSCGIDAGERRKYSSHTVRFPEIPPFGLVQTGILLFSGADILAQYDKSGRSTGFGYVNYENEVDAETAKNDLDGVLAKG